MALWPDALHASYIGQALAHDECLPGIGHPAAPKNSTESESSAKAMLRQKRVASAIRVSVPISEDCPFKSSASWETRRGRHSVAAPPTPWASQLLRPRGPHENRNEPNERVSTRDAPTRRQQMSPSVGRHMARNKHNWRARMRRRERRVTTSRTSP